MNASNKIKGARYAFSGHESFPCKSLWLKKGYDFVVSGNDFNSPEAVIGLGVGKNMVINNVFIRLKMILAEIMKSNLWLFSDNCI